jgi:hypothetical protein
MLRRDAANERLQEINPAALRDEASEMGCRLLAQMRSADRLRKRLLIGVDRKRVAHSQNGAIDTSRTSEANQFRDQFAPIAVRSTV